MARSRRTNVARGGAAASVATFAALTSHVTAGGEMPGWLGLLVPWVLSLAVCTVLSGRRSSLLRLSASVVVSQALFHLLFVVGSGTTAGASSGHMHQHDMSFVLDATTATAALPDAGMLVGHAVAAVATILALHRGERLLHRLREAAARIAGWLRRRLVAPIGAGRPPRRAMPASGRPDADRRRTAAALAPLSRRGPPVAIAI